VLISSTSALDCVLEPPSKNYKKNSSSCSLFFSYSQSERQ